MRRSQAPSTKTRPLQKLIDDGNTSFQVSDSRPDLRIDKRSTESVLNILSSLDDYCSRKNKIPRLIENVRETEEIKESKDNFSVSNYSLTVTEIFNVVYGKQTKKKHKTWEGNGTLEVGSKFLTLKDENGKVIGRKPCPKVKKLAEGERLFVGNKEIELLGLADKGFLESNETLSPAKSKVDNGSLKFKKLNTTCKKFQIPRSNYSFGMALPNPNSEHQWHFNQDGLPVSPVFVEESLAKKLRPHQKEGITFLYESIMGFRDIRQTGAILADEMGLGKTLQCIGLIWTILKQGPYGNIPAVKKVIIVAPSSLTMNWYNEFLKWLGRVKLMPFVVTQKNKPSDFRGPVMIISYEMLLRCIDNIEQYNFDLLICDEGHRLKNSNIKTTQVLNRLNCSKRIILTGTPLQNDLNEFYTLVDFVNPNILGSPAYFRSQYAEAILASRQPEADEDVIFKGKESAQNLKKITNKFILRRTRDILKNYLPPRHDVVVFCKISGTQKRLYNSSIDYLYDTKINNDFLGGSFYLEQIIVLKKICNHPSLLNSNEKPEEIPTAEESGKVRVTINFLRELQESSPNEKVVIVSSSTQTLDLLEKILAAYNYSICRLDGSTPLNQRTRIVEKFNTASAFCSKSNSFVFLLSSKAGGVGLNVTGASRLILFDSDWNPATDLQAISRIWRDGQKYPVYIYRLLTARTIEEKIYQRQLSKLGLCDGTVDPENNKSIKLSKEELKELFFTCEDDEEDCQTHEALLCDCSKGGEIPIPETEEEERSCQLVKFSKSSSKISELYHWEHHGRPFNNEFMSRLCLSTSQKDIKFIFYN